MISVSNPNEHIYIKLVLIFYSQSNVKPFFIRTRCTYLQILQINYFPIVYIHPIIELGTNKIFKSLSKLFKLSEIEVLILKKLVYIHLEECEEQKNKIVPPCI